MDDLKQWFLGQSPRDQLVLSLGGVLVSLYILMCLVLQPMQNDLAKQERRNARMLDEQVEVLSMAGQLMAVRDPGAPTGARDQSLNGIVNATTRHYGLRMDSLQPSANSARVRLGASNFNDVMAWLNDMENKRGLQIKDLTITASQLPGSVVVHLQLVQGG